MTASPVSCRDFRANHFLRHECAGSELYLITGMESPTSMIRDVGESHDWLSGAQPNPSGDLAEKLRAAAAVGAPVLLDQVEDVSSALGRHSNLWIGSVSVELLTEQQDGENEIFSSRPGHVTCIWPDQGF